MYIWTVKTLYCADSDLDLDLDSDTDSKKFIYRFLQIQKQI